MEKKEGNLKELISEKEAKEKHIEWFEKYKNMHELGMITDEEMQEITEYHTEFMEKTGD